jgi:putative restriction endonuclease
VGSISAVPCWPDAFAPHAVAERVDSLAFTTRLGNYRHVARTFGQIVGQVPDAAYADRRALADAGVHRPLQHGISGAAAEGADSIVVSGGYEDDEDYGDLIVYTGAGGRDPTTGTQIADQDFTAQNLALVKSQAEGFPVRVVRGAAGDPAYSPPAGYRYDGLFRVEESWRERGRSGFFVCRYRLIRLRDDGTPTELPPELAQPGHPAPRTSATVQRLVRNTAVTQRVKEIYRHTCQVCQQQLDTPPGPYAEGAHIRPLGRPHDGPDVEANVLCLCPNDHVRFDFGVFVIEDDYSIRTRDGKRLGRLLVKPLHRIDVAHLAYHRERFDLGAKPSSRPVVP